MSVAVEHRLTPEEQAFWNKLSALRPSKQARMLELMGLFVQTHDDDERYEIAALACKVLNGSRVRVESLKTTQSGEEKLRNHRTYVGREIKRLREKRGMTQEQLAEASGLRQPHVCRLERGEHVATFRTIQKVADALEVAPGIIDASFE